MTSLHAMQEPQAVLSKHYLTQQQAMLDINTKVDRPMTFADWQLNCAGQVNPIIMAG